MAARIDPFGARTTLQLAGGSVDYYRLEALTRRGISDLHRLPYTVRILLENALRICDGTIVELSLIHISEPTRPY